MNLKKKAVVVVGILMGLSFSHAQERVLGEAPADQPPLPPALDLPLMSPEVLPETGNFFSAFNTDWPPLPYNPLATNWNVPVYSLAGVVGHPSCMPFYLIDDRAWFMAKEQTEKEALALQMFEAAARGEKLTGVRSPGDAGDALAPKTVARGLIPTGTDLLVDIEDATNGVVSLTIFNPDSMTNSPVWDVFATTNLNSVDAGLNGTNWAWVLRTDPGQTNVLTAMLSEFQCYFRLAGTNDTDGDSLSDALEALSSHSDPALVDSDSDGMTDDYEWVHFATMAQGAADDFEGDGVGNLAEMNAGFDPGLADTDSDGRIDELFAVQILSPR